MEVGLAVLDDGDQTVSMMSKTCNTKHIPMYIVCSTVSKQSNIFHSNTSTNSLKQILLPDKAQHLYTMGNIKLGRSLENRQSTRLHFMLYQSLNYTLIKKSDLTSTTAWGVFPQLFMIVKS